MIGIYHLLSFGLKTPFTLILVFGYLLVALIILIATFSYLGQVDWQSKILFFDGYLNSNSSFIGF